ncbi:MAG: MHYT domain-containing protein [Gemmatimonadota bacterium]
MALSPALHSSHHSSLVVVAIAIAVLAAFAALSVAERIHVSIDERTRHWWLAVGALSMGIGIWAMHFVGMLSWHLPVPVAYDIVTTLVSVFPAIFASAVALQFLSAPHRTAGATALGGLAMVAGIGTMHFTAMEAMRMSAVLYYRPVQFGLSLVVAVVLAIVVLSLRPAMRRSSLPPVARQGVRALILGGAVSAMHFTAMHAARVFADPTLPIDTDVLPSSTLLTLVTSAVTILVSLTLVATFADRRLSDLSDRLLARDARLRAVLNSMADGVVTFDEAGTIEATNPAAEQMFGLDANGLEGKNITSIFPFLSPGALTRHSGEYRVGPVLSRRLETEGRRQSGEGFLVELVVADVGLSDRTLFSGVVRNITDRVEADRRLRQHVSDLETARTELQSHAAQLSVARDRAEEAARAKSEFLATMSHELRTPMNGVLGMAQLLLHSPLTEEQMGRVRILQRSGEALLRIINDVLDFSKIEAGKLSIDTEPFDLITLLEEVRETVAAAADIAGLSLTVEIHPDCPRWVMGDGGRVRQVLLNLVGNAIKFTDQGSVSISATPAAGSDGASQIVLKVTDTGIGLSQDTINRLFSPFTQADGSTTRRHGGTGLGLVISKRLAEMMHGSLIVSSTVGVGSCFSMSLPLPATNPPAPAVDAPTWSALAVSNLRLGSADLPRVPHVLVAEDNMINQVVAVSLLSHLGCTVDVASDGREAVRRWSGGAYDLILMDCQMPEMDGLEATRVIRKGERDGARIPIVALTANAMTEDRAACLAAGMDDHISKPVTEQALTDALMFARRALARR